jgi:5,10-methylenetetrahydromethanopterin reductase
MRIGTSLAEPQTPQALRVLRDELMQAADDGFASAWMANIFGLDALTALAVAGSGIQGMEIGTAVVPTYPRHPAVLAQQALTTALALDSHLALGIGLSHKIVIEDMYGYSFDAPAVHMREYLSALLPLLDGEPVSFNGTTVRASIGLSTPRAAHGGNNLVDDRLGDDQGLHSPDDQRRSAGGRAAGTAHRVHAASVRDRRS